LTAQRTTSSSEEQMRTCVTTRPSTAIWTSTRCFPMLMPAPVVCGLTTGDTSQQCARSPLWCQARHSVRRVARGLNVRGGASVLFLHFCSGLGLTASCLQINCTYFSAVGNHDEWYLLARAIQFFTPGIPLVYYVGLLAGANDIELVEQTKVGRDINRHPFCLEEAVKETERPVVRVRCYSSSLPLFLFFSCHMACTTLSSTLFLSSVFALKTHPSLLFFLHAFPQVHLIGLLRAYAASLYAFFVLIFCMPIRLLWMATWTCLHAVCQVGCMVHGLPW
jgi:hypothetical protein